MIAELLALSDDELTERYAAALAELGITTEEEAARRLDHQAAADLEEWSRLRYEFPLADQILWEHPDATWSQRNLMLELVDHHLTLVVGGHGSGKTFGVIQLTIAHALGSDHQMVAAWLADNHLPPDLVPPGPGQCCLVAPSAAQSIEFHRGTLDELLPATGKHWRMKDAPQEASVELEVPGYPKKGKIYLKSVDQKRKAFKGGKYRFIGLSEEPEGEEGRLVVEECLRATARVGGRMVVEATPQHGYTWMYDDLYIGRQYDCAVVELNAEFNVLVDDHASLMRYFAAMPQEQRAMRQFGKFTDLRGAVYPGWDPGDGSREGRGHLVDPFPIPAEWPKWRVADWGQTKKNGTAVLWFALAPDGTLFIYREYYLDNEPNFEVHAANCRLLEPRDEVITRAVADHEPEAIAAFGAVGLHFQPADKDRGQGISRCTQRLAVVGTRPRLKVFKPGPKGSGIGCPEFCREMPLYRRDPNKKDGSPIKKDDHALDCWRYAENDIAEWQGNRASSAAVRRGTAAWLERLGGRRR